MSLTSQAMIYVLAVVIASYKLDWVASAVCAVGAVTALNFFFVPPRWTFEVENQEHFIALGTMLVVALVISHLATGRAARDRDGAPERTARAAIAGTGHRLANVSSPARVWRSARRPWTPPLPDLVRWP